MHKMIAVALMLFVGALMASETGMCLVVCKKGGYDDIGEIRRIDVENSSVKTTSGVLGTGRFTRFSPDGTKFAYITAWHTGNIVIANLDGTVVKSFKPAATQNLSWGTAGIYIGTGSSIQLYNPETGEQIMNKGFSNCDNAYVSQNGTMGVGMMCCGWRVISYNFATGASVEATDQQCCSGSPSPDGRYALRNLFEPGKEHRTTSILLTSDMSTEVHHFDIGEILGLGAGYCWNRQIWSGNSMDIIVFPVGGWGAQPGTFLEPWIYNIATGEAVQLADNSTSDNFWQPYDYYAGKIPGTEIPVIRLSDDTLKVTAFTSTNPSNVSITASTAAGTLSNIAVQESASWLSVTPSALNGASVNLVNSFNISGLSTGHYSTTVTVTTSNAGSKRYEVDLTITENLVFSSVSVTPSARTILPNDTLRFTAQPLDQFGGVISGVQIAWSLVGQGTLTNGLYTAPQTTGGPWKVIANAGSFSDTAMVAVSAETHDTCIKSLRILSPNATANFTPGQTITVRWECFDSRVSGVVVSFTPDAGLTSVVLSTNTINQSSPLWSNFTWTIPDSIMINDIEQSTSCTNGRIIVSDYNLPSIMDENDEDFSIIKNTSMLSRKSHSIQPGVVLSRKQSGYRLTIDMHLQGIFMICDLKGRCIENHKFSGPASYEFPLSKLPKGTCVIQLKTQTGTRIERLVF